MITKFLRWLGYVKIDHGVACGRCYLKIDGKTIAQTPGDDIWMKDEDICDLARGIAPGCEWKKAYRLTDDYPNIQRSVGVMLKPDREAAALAAVLERKLTELKR